MTVLDYTVSSLRHVRDQHTTRVLDYRKINFNKQRHHQSASNFISLLLLLLILQVHGTFEFVVNRSISVVYYDIWKHTREGTRRSRPACHGR
jgi:hypothetical protein